MKLVDVNDVFPLHLQLDDGATDQFPRAWVMDYDGSTFTGSPFDLSHTANGLYRNISATATTAGLYYVQYKVYSDSGFTTASTVYEQVTDVVTVDNLKTTVANNNTLIGAIDAFAVEAIGYIDESTTAIGLSIEG